MILKDKKIIFVHIPKTAGQSVTNYFLKNLGESFTLTLPELGLTENLDLNLQGPQNHHHMFLNEYVDLGYLTENEISSYFKLCVLRNPFERFISSFYYNRLHKKFSYRTFIDKVLPRRTVGYERTDLYRHFCPQVNYINSQYANIDKFFVIDDNFNKTFTNYFFTNYSFEGNLDRDINKTKVRPDKIIPLDNVIKSKLTKIYKDDFKLYRSLLKHKHDHRAT